MAYFVLIGRDRPDMGERRLALRPAHQAHFFQPKDGCRAVAGGPLLDDRQEAMIGSLLVFEAEDKAAVERFMATDPYMLGDLFQTTEILPWRWGFGRPMADQS
jgi:uncharacterized protein YciI